MADHRIMQPVKLIDGVSGATSSPKQLGVMLTGDTVANSTTGGILILGSDGSNYRAVKTDSTGIVSVSAAQSGTWNITNVSGTVSLPTGAATEASLAKLTLGQGSTTSGQTGALILGAVTTAAPSYTTAQSSPLSLTTGGLLRVDPGTVTVTGTVAATQSGTWNITNISGTVSLPTGAATAAKQPALGTAGSPSTDVITVQGRSGMTALDVAIVSGGSVDSPTTPAFQNLTSSALAAGSSVNLDTTDIASKYCWGAEFTSSVAFKVVVSTLSNAVATTVTVIFGTAGQLVSWRPPSRKFVQSGSTAGADGFRAAFSNLDSSDAADVYATFFYADN
jgi:hypothetical protein